jgi:hypothetical protein
MSQIPFFSDYSVQKVAGLRYCLLVSCSGRYSMQRAMPFLSLFPVSRNAVSTP